jgi:energy-coupling factor transporter ATP-binding protein EcfA2
MSKKVLVDLLIWSQNRELWIRDALRRIVVKGDLNDDDISRLYQLCMEEKNQNQLAEEAVPLTADHVPSADCSSQTVRILSLSNLEGVNRLAGGQELQFGEAGLTVVYGDNGAGKSGYARVIKKACRSRGATPVINPNIFSNNERRPATATFKIRVEEKDDVTTWENDKPSLALLANVMVFDHVTAKHYVEEEGAAALTPYGLDILPKLAKACDAVGEKIQDKISQIEQQIRASSSFISSNDNTTISWKIQNLTHESDIRYFEQISQLSDQELTRKDELAFALNPRSSSGAAETKAAAERIASLKRDILSLESALSESNLFRIKQTRDLYIKAQIDAKNHESTFDGSSYLPGTGSERWRKMLGAAEEFSHEIGPAEVSLHPGGKCVLCQSNITEETGRRLSTFVRFNKDHAQESLRQASLELDKTKLIIEKLPNISLAVKIAEADLHLLSEENKTLLLNYTKHLESRVVLARQILDGASLPIQEELPNGLKAVLENLQNTLTERARIESASLDPAKKQELSSELRELEARSRLKGIISHIDEQIKRLKNLHFLMQRKSSTSTRSITEKSAELSRELVTKAYCESFKKEMHEIGRNTLGVSVQDVKGKKGEVKFALQFANANKYKVHEIASEGEQRCIALAAFLSELSQSSNHSTIVFDDPVTSLDGMHHRKIAERLAKESSNRQVIVFTHNYTFWLELIAAAESSQVPVATPYIEWANNEPGYCHETVPWEWKRAKDALDKHEKCQKRIEAEWNDVPTSKNIEDIRRAYSKLRATLENMLEQHTLGGVILRRRKYIDTKHIRKLAGITEVECSEYSRLIQICHDFVDAHGDAVGNHLSIRNPADLFNDIKSAHGLLQMAAARAKQ